MKVCKCCRVPKKLSEFYCHAISSDGLQPKCKVCCSAYQREVGPDGLTRQARWRKANPGKTRIYVRKYKYGITLEQFNEMLLAQNHACAICRGTNVDWHVDHDHATGKVRALLCQSCNFAIGFLKDSARIALSAAEYLTKHGNP